jgi:hypothetical protein
MTTYLAGSIVRSTVTFVPETGNTSIGNVSAVATDAAGNRTVLTVAQVVTDQYKADITIPDTAIDGPWVVRWESSSPKISAEDHFTVGASDALNP